MISMGTSVETTISMRHQSVASSRMDKIKEKLYSNILAGNVRIVTTFCLSFFLLMCYFD